MGKSFLNKISKKGSKFLHAIDTVATKELDTVKDVFGGGSLVNSINDNPLILAVNPIAQAQLVYKSRGTKRGRKLGQILETGGSVIALAGTLTGQPEISAIGVGLQVVGGFEKGESAGQIVGEVLGGMVGGELGPVGGSIGSQLGGQLGDALDQATIDSGSNRTHNSQMKDQIKENRHIDDIHNHHNQVKLPGDLQGGNNTGIVGNSLMMGLDEVLSGTKDILVEGVANATGLDSGTVNQIGQVLGYLASNFEKFEALAKADRDDVFDTLLDSGLLDDFLRMAIQVAA